MTRRLGALLALLLCPLPGAAQEQAGSIEGAVKDPSGAVVTGARVTAEARMGLAVATFSDGAGRYRFASLPVGEYAVTARSPGFPSARVGDIQLRLGQILEVDLDLTTPGVAESVTVAAEPPRIDVRQSGRATSIRDEQITLLPKGRDYTSLITQATAANAEGHPDWRGISIDGSSGSENRYVVDGIDTTHLTLGSPALGVVTDVVEEVQVRSSGYAAEHSGGTGGVINVVTRSGSNRWSGHAGAYYSSDRLKGSPRPLLLRSVDFQSADLHVFPKDSFHSVEPSIVVGGPLKRDVAWFFAALSPAMTSTERTVTFQPSGQVETFRNERRTGSGNASVSAQLGDRVRGRVGFNMSHSVEDGSLPFVHGRVDPRNNFDVVTTSPSRAISGNVDYIATPHLVLSARAGYWFANTEQDGIFQGPRYVFAASNVGRAGVPAELQQQRGYSSVFTNTEMTRNIFERVTGQLDATFHVSAAGRHAVKAGIQVERLHNDIVQGETGNVVFLSWGTSPGAFGSYSVRSNGVIPERGVLTEGDVHSNNYALFVQDAWTIANRLTLNVGVRSERESIPSYTSAYGVTPKGIDFGFGEKLAPRVGAAWDVRGDGRWKAYGSWGLFYDAMKYSMARERFGGGKWLDYSYSLETADWPSLMRPGCPPACPGTLLTGPIDRNKPANSPDNNAVDPDIEPFRMQEAAIGVEHALTGQISVGARYLHKQVDVAVEDMGIRDAVGNRVYLIGNPGFHRGAEAGLGRSFPKAVRDYDALELTVDKRMAARWALHASYVLSRLYGNYTGLSEGEEGTPRTNIGGTFNQFFETLGADGQPLLGVLPGDRTHQLKAHAIHQLSFGPSIGVSARAMTGTPVTRYASFNGYGIAYRGRGSDGRLPVLSQVDLYAQHEIAVGGNKRVQLGINVINLFDQASPLLRFSSELLEDVAITDAGLLAGFDGDALIGDQEPRRDPMFLQDYVFQEARAVRLSVKLVF